MEGAIEDTLEKMEMSKEITKPLQLSDMLRKEYGIIYCSVCGRFHHPEASCLTGADLKVSFFFPVYETGGNVYIHADIVFKEKHPEGFMERFRKFMARQE